MATQLQLLPHPQVGIVVGYVQPFLDHMGAPAERSVYAKVRMLGDIPERDPEVGGRRDAST